MQQLQLKKPELKTSSQTTSTNQKPIAPILKKQNQPISQPTKAVTDLAFQAIGIIVGNVSFDENDKAFISINNKRYPLFYATNRQRSMIALRKEVARTGQLQRLVVYPRILHLPKQGEPYKVSFHLVGFDKKELPAQGIASQLKDFEFKLCGNLQYIPVCKDPVISVFKNHSEDRVDFLKSLTPAFKKYFLKATHIPVRWSLPPIRPFRFSPKAPKPLDTYFVEVSTFFDSKYDTFEFLEILSHPSPVSPRYLKAPRLVARNCKRTDTTSQNSGKKKINIT